MSQDVVSFVLRFVREAGEEQQARWRGIVKHVQSNTETTFTQFTEAMSFMQNYVTDVAQASFDETRKMGESFSEANPFMETARLWGNLMPEYTQQMMENVGAMMGGEQAQAVTKPFEQAMNAALSAWGIKTPADTAESADATVDLTAQLEAMQAKIAELEEKLAAAQEK